jgi:hypothetical protein
MVYTGWWWCSISAGCGRHGDVDVGPSEARLHNHAKTCYLLPQRLNYAAPVFVSQHPRDGIETRINQDCLISRESAWPCALNYLYRSADSLICILGFSVVE